jgi:hypothetical protein
MMALAPAHPSGVAGAKAIIRRRYGTTKVVP